MAEKTPETQKNNYWDGFQNANIEILWTHLGEIREDMGKNRDEINANMKTGFGEIKELLANKPCRSNSMAIVDLQATAKTSKTWLWAIGSVIGFMIATGVVVAFG